jgi:plasmid stabilization system protein ParE
VSLQLSLRPEASADVAEAFSWYQAQRVGLGEEFRTDLDATFTLLLRMPEAGPVVHRGLRRALLRHFPYAVYYGTSEALLEVRAVLHQHRSPAAWRRRG